MATITTRLVLLWLAVLTGALALALIASPVIHAAPVTLTIVHVNDLDRLAGVDDGRSGGVARLAAVVNQVRTQAKGPVLVTNGGDTISPSLLSSFDRGAHMIELFNRVGFDAMALGNHEFDFGPEVTTERVREANFPILSNNAIEPDGTLIDGVTPNLLFEFGRFKVGLFGLTTATTAMKSLPAHITFRPAAEVASEQAKELRERGADLVIALAHTDRTEDVALMRSGVVDVLLSGDDHDLRFEIDDTTGTLFVESGSQAEFVSIVEIVMDDEDDRFTWRPTFRLIDTAQVSPDPELAKVVDGHLAWLARELDIEIGTTAVELDSRYEMVRRREAPIANFIADAMRAATGADIALTHGGGIKAAQVRAPGTALTRRDIHEELPFGNRTIVIEVTGADLRAALENGVSQVEEGAGRFPHVSGMAYRFDASKPPGERIAEVTITGAPLDPTRTYRLATNDFLGRGGDGYDMFARAPRLIDENAARLQVAQVIEAITAAGTIAPRPEGRITRLDSPH